MSCVSVTVSGRWLSFAGAVSCAVAPFDDPNVRWALSYAIDRQQLVEFGYRGAGEPTTVPYPYYAPLGAISGLQTIAASALDVIDTAVSIGDTVLDAANALNPAFLAGPGLAQALDDTFSALTGQDALLQARGLAGRISANVDTLGV